MKDKKIAVKCMFVIGLILGLGYIRPLEAHAEVQILKEATLTVEDTVFVEKGEVLETKKYDGEGGSVTYDPETNTLTLNNYHFKTLTSKWGIDRFIHVSKMSTYQPFHVVLVGTNVMIRDENKREEQGVEDDCIDFYMMDAIIEGNGKLISNTLTSADNLTIRDCDIEIHGYYYGIYCQSLTLENANVILTSEHPSHVGGVLSTGTDGLDGGLTIKNSTLRVKANGGNFQSVLLEMSREAGADQINTPEDKIHLSDDITVTDDEGNPLHVCGCKWSGANWFVYSKDGAEKTYLTDDDALISRSVNFLSSAKENENAIIAQVIDSINAIGDVTLDSLADIEKARQAYEALDSLGDRADYAKEKIRNYELLVNAETSYTEIKAAEEKRIAEEAKKAAEEKKAEEEKKQSESIKSDQQGGQETDSNKDSIPDKVIKVNNKKYTLKTPTLKSVKSKKKKTVTLKWSTDKKCTGYQISYSTSKKFKKAKKITIKGYKNKSRTIKQLKSRKNYYIKIREYKTINGKKYYGNWSKVKKIKIK
ncbi:MAG: hypothetical protein IJ711_05465 [Lachnospiraceae bacterium]|nr:hypothetical protein [Lachnospiraceae bacterium]